MSDLPPRLKTYKEIWGEDNPSEIAALRAEVERLREQLPDGMKDCTIVFKECREGHGRLAAMNWIQHECPACEIAALRERVRDLEGKK